MQMKTIKSETKKASVRLTYLVSAPVAIVKVRVKKFKSGAATTKDAHAVLVAVGKAEG